MFTRSIFAFAVIAIAFTEISTERIAGNPTSMPAAPTTPIADADAPLVVAQFVPCPNGKCPPR